MGSEMAEMVIHRQVESSNNNNNNINKGNLSGDQNKQYHNVILGLLTKQSEFCWSMDHQPPSQHSATYFTQKNQSLEQAKGEVKT